MPLFCLRAKQFLSDCSFDLHSKIFVKTQKGCPMKTTFSFYIVLKVITSMKENQN